jgi:GGDEF domain-containing protein
MSIGVAHYIPPGEPSLEALIKEADAAMYRQKRPGGATAGA